MIVEHKPVGDRFIRLLEIEKNNCFGCVPMAGITKSSTSKSGNRKHHSPLAMAHWSTGITLSRVSASFCAAL